MNVQISVEALETLLEVSLAVARDCGVQALLEIDHQVGEKLDAINLDFGTAPCQLTGGRVIEISIFSKVQELRTLLGIDPSKHFSSEEVHQLVAA